MKKFNKLFNKILESNTVGGVMGVSGGIYAAGDNRPIEPARAVIGAKYSKKSRGKNSQQTVKVPIQRRAPIETVFLKGK